MAVLKSRGISSQITIIMASTLIMMCAQSPISAQTSIVNKSEIQFRNGAGWESVGTDAIPAVRAKEPILLKSGQTVEDAFNELSGDFYEGFSSSANMLSTIQERLIGMVAAFAFVPDSSTGWLVCDGSEYVGGTYQDLANIIQDSYGGTGSLNSSNNWNGTFRVPDLRGIFIMGTTDEDLISTINLTTTIPYHNHRILNSSTINSSNQGGQTHFHTVNSLLATVMQVDNDESDSGTVYGSTNSNIPDTDSATVSHSHTIPGIDLTLTGAIGAIAENRPPNAAVVYCIYSGVTN